MVISPPPSIKCAYCVGVRTAPYGTANNKCRVVVAQRVLQRAMHKDNKKITRLHSFACAHSVYRHTHTGLEMERGRQTGEDNTQTRNNLRFFIGMLFSWSWSWSSNSDGSGDGRSTSNKTRITHPRIKSVIG